MGMGALKGPLQGGFASIFAGDVGFVLKQQLQHFGIAPQGGVVESHLAPFVPRVDVRAACQQQFDDRTAAVGHGEVEGRPSVGAGLEVRESRPFAE